MSRKQVYVNVSDIAKSRPIPFTEKPMKKGDGKATYKTATAAANAAKEARDEAKEAAEASRVHQIACDNAKVMCEICAESVVRTVKRDMWWKILLLASLLAEILVRLMT